MSPVNFYTNYCISLKESHRLRKLSVAKNDVKNKVMDFSTNDYLGLSCHPDLLTAAYECGQIFGVGSTGSRLLSGNKEIFEQLEEQIAQDKKTEAALIFNSGYQANLSVLAALCDKAIIKKQALLFFDKFNHASLYQAVFLSDAYLVRYRHNDVTHLKQLLETYQNDPRPKFIVAETLFGMDGDIVQLSELTLLASKFKAFLYLDEAHATGVLGEKGYGYSTSVALNNIPNVVMGTFSKGVGVCGAYVACSNVIKDYLINRCSGLIYSTALSPMVIGAVLKAWEMIPTFHAARKQLFKKASYVRMRLQEMGFDTGLSNSHIIPIILKEEALVLKARELLLDKGIIVSAVRPPTVPAGTARIRIALTIRHQDTDIEQLLMAIRSL